MNDFLKSKKNIISALTLLILILAVPLGMQLIRQQQIIRSRAVEASVTFSGPNVAVQNNKTVLKQTINASGQPEANVDLVITSSLGPPGAGASANPSPTPSPATGGGGGGTTTGGGGASVDVTE